MAIFKITDPTSGRTVKLTSKDNTPPTEQEIENIFSSVQDQFKSAEREKSLEGVDPNQILRRQETSGGTSFSEEEMRTAAKRQITQGEEEFKQSTAPKDFLDTAAGVSPEELMSSSRTIDQLAGSVQQAGKDVVSIPANFFNQLLLNAPREIVESAGYDYPSDAKNKAVNVASKIAGVAGALQGGKAIIGAAGKIPAVASKIGTGAIRGAVAGTARGLLETPRGSGESGDLLAIKDRSRQALTQGILGGAVGAGAGAISKAGQQSSVTRYVNKLDKKILPKYTNQLDQVNKSIAEAKKAGNTSVVKSLTKVSDELGNRLNDLQVGSDVMKYVDDLPLQKITKAGIQKLLQKDSSAAVNKVAKIIKKIAIRGAGSVAAGAAGYKVSKYFM